MPIEKTLKTLQYLRVHGQRMDFTGERQETRRKKGKDLKRTSLTRQTNFP
jgi:hypothetical protein